jgi:hypothetical protein
MHGGQHGRVIQGFFAGPPRLPAPPTGIGRHAASLSRPGPPPGCGPGPAVQAKPAAGRLAHVGHLPPVHGADQRFEVDPVRIGLARNGGAALPQPLLAKMEAAFGADFSAVRIHVGPQPARIGALAFTTGNQLYFTPGQYQPNTPQGQRLIGHELAHVVQQRQGRVPARGTGVTVIQNKLLEAEADRLGARAAAWRAGPAAPGRPAPARPALPGRPAPVSTVQRATDPLFPIEGFARHIFDKGARTVKQSDLHSIVSPSGSSKSGFIPLDQFQGNDYTLSEASQGVIARLKVNGVLLVIGANKHTSDKPTFVAGTQMRGNNKDNFHAEDWAIRGFKKAFSRAKKVPNQGGWTLDTWLNSLGGGKAGNAGNPGKHFISMAVSACPCLGCAVSLRTFQAYLQTALGAQNFVFRVKFLRTYDLNIKTKARTSDTATAFISTIGGLIEAGIHVRMQPTRSAEKLNGNQAFNDEIPRSFATNHDAVHHILDDAQGNFLRQSWYEMKVSRKGLKSAGEKGVIYDTKFSRDSLQFDYGRMTSHFVVHGSEADNPVSKKKARNPSRATGSAMRTTPTPRHAPYSQVSTPHARQQQHVTTTTTTTVYPPPPYYGGPYGAPPYYPPQYGAPPQYPHPLPMIQFPQMHPGFAPQNTGWQQMPPQQGGPYQQIQQPPPHQGGYPQGGYMPPPGNSGGNGTGM